MEKRQDKETKINRITDSDIESIRLIIQKLQDIADLSEEKELETDPLITEESVETLESIVRDLLIMKDSHHKYLVRWLKQGYLIQ